MPIGRDPLPVTRDQLFNSEEKTVASEDTGYGSPVTGHETTAQLDALVTQKSDVDKKIADARVVRNVPQQVYLSYLMLRRELLGKVNALLTSHCGMSRIDETKEDLAFQVIDKAVPPVKKYSPKRGLICIMSFMTALFLSVLLAFFRDYLDRMRAMAQKP